MSTNIKSPSGCCSSALPLLPPFFPCATKPAKGVTPRPTCLLPPLLSACSTREQSREAATGLPGQQRKAETSLGGRDLSDPRTCVPSPEERTLAKHELTGGDSSFANGSKALTRDCTLRRGVLKSCPGRPPSLLHHTHIQHHRAI